MGALDERLPNHRPTPSSSSHRIANQRCYPHPPPLPCLSASESSSWLGTRFGRELRVGASYGHSKGTEVQLGAPRSQVGLEGEHSGTKSVAKTLGKTGGSLSNDLVPLSCLSPLSLLPHPCLFPTGVKMHPDVLPPRWPKPPLLSLPPFRPHERGILPPRSRNAIPLIRLKHISLLQHRFIALIYCCFSAATKRMRGPPP